MKVLAGLGPYLEVLQMNQLPGSFVVLAEFSSLWACDWVPISLLAIGPGLMSASRGCSWVLLHHLLHPENPLQCVRSFLCCQSL